MITLWFRGIRTRSRIPRPAEQRPPLQRRNPGGEPYDQRGVPRPRSGGNDAGACQLTNPTNTAWPRLQVGLGPPLSIGLLGVLDQLGDALIELVDGSLNVLRRIEGRHSVP